MMKPCSLFLGVFLVVMVPGLSAQNTGQNMKADRAIQVYLAAIGGRGPLTTIQDRTTHAKLMVMGMTGAMEWHEKIPNKMHQSVDLVVAKVEYWFDGRQGYRIDPMQGAGPYSDKELVEAKENYVITPLLQYKERGWAAEYVGEEPMGGGTADVVRLTNSAGVKQVYYFDSSTHYMVKQVSPLPAREGEGTQELLFSDYREVGGFKFPFLIKRITPGMTSEIVVDSIEVNKGMEDSLFQYQGDPWRILARHLEAIGGLEAWQELKSLRRNAVLQIVNMQGFATTIWKSPSSFYHEVQLGQTQMKLGSDGKMGWMGEQTAGEVAVKDWKTYTYLWSSRYLFPDSGVSAHYKGTEKVGERDAYVVSLQFPFGAEVTCYYDKESYLLLRDVSRHSAPGIDNLSIATIYEDYRPVGRLKLPFQFREEVPLATPIVADFKIKDYELNQKAEDSLFQPAARPQPPR